MFISAKWLEYCLATITINPIHVLSIGFFFFAKYIVTIFIGSVATLFSSSLGKF